MSIRRVKQNVWGNWNGYIGRRKVIEFGPDDVRAGYWKITGKDDRNGGYKSQDFAKLCKEAAQ